MATEKVASYMFSFVASEVHFQILLKCNILRKLSYISVNFATSQSICFRFSSLIENSLFRLKIRLKTWQKERGSSSDILWSSIFVLEIIIDISIIYIYHQINFRLFFGISENYQLYTSYINWVKMSRIFKLTKYKCKL